MIEGSQLCCFCAQRARCEHWPAAWTTLTRRSPGALLTKKRPEIRYQRSCLQRLRETDKVSQLTRHLKVCLACSAGCRHQTCVSRMSSHNPLMTYPCAIAFSSVAGVVESAVYCSVCIRYSFCKSHVADDKTPRTSVPSPCTVSVVSRETLLKVSMRVPRYSRTHHVFGCD